MHSRCLYDAPLSLSTHTSSSIPDTSNQPRTITPPWTELPHATICCSPPSAVPITMLVSSYSHWWFSSTFSAGCPTHFRCRWFGTSRHRSHFLVVYNFCLCVFPFACWVVFRYTSLVLCLCSSLCTPGPVRMCSLYAHLKLNLSSPLVVSFMHEFIISTSCEICVQSYLNKVHCLWWLIRIAPKHS